MKMANEKHVLRNLLQAFTIIFLLTVKIGVSSNEGLFRKISNSQCIDSWLIRTQATPTIIECSLCCLATDKCGFFSYCNDTCKMFQPLSVGNVELVSCDCISYLMLHENSRSWQKVLEISTSSFKRSALYAYWTSWPIEKVKLWFVRRSHRINSITFNGTNKNSTAWFNEMNLLSRPWYLPLPVRYMFSLREKYFIIEPEDGGDYMLYAEKVNETYYNISFRMSSSRSLRSHLDALDVYVLLE
ncbi:uncharacterized protein LOC106876624 [Octopus bimaculoides]|uniref:Apple domain-containing protein n=1 Tax=Octopus bimaculoides TaxID=37653 RepID=A0A0L8GII0_OCTBM|nr:uncharacterized protein LOC106876624 [Octopus bimaculoides]|eukprot:XP_014780725.1 PREDICTED: uncharacterized protein LOC106876624 [Octopus bimaculoides]